MATSQDVEAKINEMLKVSARAFRNETEAGYQEFQGSVNDLEGAAREAFQAKLADLYWPILAKLEEGKGLTTAEHDILEMLIVGEAKYYLRYENDVNQWKDELKRLLEEIKKQQAAGLDEIDSLMRLRALCREVTQVVPELIYYFRERERVRKFEEATAGAIDVDTRRALANLIKQMIESDKL
jgi:hypothetical protein